VLRIAASPGDDAISVRLRTLMGGLDHRNITLIAHAITRANSRTSHPAGARPPRRAARRHCTPPVRHGLPGEVRAPQGLLMLTPGAK